MGKKRDRHAELVELLEEVLEELRRRPAGPPWEVTIQPARPPWPPHWQAEPRPIVTPMVVLYGVGAPSSPNYTTGDHITVH